MQAKTRRVNTQGGTRYLSIPGGSVSAIFSEPQILSHSFEEPKIRILRPEKFRDVVKYSGLSLS